MDSQQGQWFAIVGLLLLALSIWNFSYIEDQQEGVFAGFEYFNSSGQEFIFSDANTYYEFSGGDCGLSNRVVCNNSSFVIQEEGVYRITYGATGVGDNNHLYITAVSINGEIKNNTRDLMETSAQEMKKMRGDAEFFLREGDVIKMEIQDTSSPSNALVYEFDCNIQRLSY